MNTFPLFKQKQIISSILTLIMIIITSAIIPTITTIINKTTNIEHPPYDTRGRGKSGRYGLSMGGAGLGSGGRGGGSMAYFKTNESITSSRPDSSENPTNYTNCTTVDQLCRIVAAENTLGLPTPEPPDFHYS